MVKKISGRERGSEKGERKRLHTKTLKLKRLHRSVADDRAELESVPTEQLPPASASNAARQARSKRNITFPIDWQDRHMQKHQAEKARKRKAEADR